MKVGPLFAQSIHTEKIPKRHSFHVHTHAMRYGFFLLSILFFLGLLFMRLIYVQLIQGDYYKALSDSNRIHTTVLHAPRGVIFDRNGKPLVYNTPGFREVIHGKTTFLDSPSAISLLAKGDRHLEIDSLRMYPCKDACAHVIGYVGQISPSQLKDPLFSQYLATDVVGQMGIEEQYESILKGTDGQKLVEVDATGKPLGVLGQTDPLPGQNITLTLDESLQKSVAHAMSGVKKGAAIVSTPDGQILALYSAPSFDPNLFTMGKYQTPNATGQGSAYTSVEQILTDTTNQPLLNRAISGTYPPGSTFKPVVAGAALQNNIIDQNFTVNDTGILRVGDFSFANWYYTDYGRTEGELNVVGAIRRSNDIFFYKVGQMVGVDRLSGFAKQFGLGKTSGIDLPAEAAGLLPTKEWKEKVIGDRWYLGDDYHYGIGQGYLLTTPLQVNLWTQAIANGGVLYQPHLLKTNPIKEQANLLTPQNASLIRQGMIEACSTGGVAWPLFNFNVKRDSLNVKGIDAQDLYEVDNATSSGQIGVRVACKTGTAEHGDTTKTMPHAWITLFAPAYHPQIVVTVLSEDSGEGSNVAGPIAKEILTDYFEK